MRLQTSHLKHGETSEGSSHGLEASLKSIIEFYNVALTRRSLLEALLKGMSSVTGTSPIFLEGAFLGELFVPFLHASLQGPFHCRNSRFHIFKVKLIRLTLFQISFWGEAFW
jgi:hypothetical protein